MLYLNILLDVFWLLHVFTYDLLSQLLSEVMEVLKLINIFKLELLIWENWQLVCPELYLHVAEPFGFPLHELGLGPLEKLIDLQASLGEDQWQALHDWINI